MISLPGAALYPFENDVFITLDGGLTSRRVRRFFSPASVLTLNTENTALANIHHANTQSYIRDMGHCIALPASLVMCSQLDALFFRSLTPRILGKPPRLVIVQAPPYDSKVEPKETFQYLRDDILGILIEANPFQVYLINAFDISNSPGVLMNV